MEDFLQLMDCFSEEEKLLQETLRKSIDENIIPLMPEAFESGVFPDSCLQAVIDLSLFGMTLPEKYGGLSASHVAYGLACQELERADSAIRSLVSVQSSLCMHPIYAYGSALQKEKYLQKMASGQLIGCFGLTEPNSGSDPASMKTSASRVKGGWRINGTKLWITNATIADIAIVWAKTEEGVRGFIVEKGTEGFSSNLITDKLSLRISNTGELVFKDCFIPESACLPGTSIGLQAALNCLTKARFGIAWGAIGAAMACYEIACEYTAARHQFSKPLASFQLVQSSLVEMLLEITKAQALNFRVAQLLDQGKANYTHVSMAKMNACRQALKIARESRNLLGANGISSAYPIMRHLINLETVFTYEGSDNMHQLILGRHITKFSAFS